MSDNENQEDNIDVIIGMVDMAGIPHVVINFNNHAMSLVLPKEQAIQFAELILKHARQQ